MDSSALLLVWIFVFSGASSAEPGGAVSLLAGQDMHLRTAQMTVYTDPILPWDHILGFSGGATVTVGDNRISGREGFVWLTLHGIPSQHPAERYYQAYVYLEGNVLVEQGPRSKTTAMRQTTVKGADSLATQFTVTGDVFSAAEQRHEAPFSQLPADPVYQRGLSALSPLAFGPGIPKAARVPMRVRPGAIAAEPAIRPDPALRPVDTDVPQPRPDTTEEPSVVYPVHIASLWEPASAIEITPLPDGEDVAIASGRFYVWQQQRDGSIVEFMADNVVLYFERGQFNPTAERRGNELGSGVVRKAYLSGNIVFTESDRTVRADEIFYDFRNQRALIVNASMRVFDPRRGIPFYVRAEKLGRVSEYIFEAENVQLTSSEFYLPQLSLNASRMVLLTEEHSIEQYDAAAQDRARMYDMRLYDIDVRYENFTFFRWPGMRTDFVRPDTPLSRIRFGNDSNFGTFLETRWHFARLLGFKEPPGMDSRLALDYFSKRGFGAGLEGEYETDQAFGSFQSYLMSDRGHDDLGRIAPRRHLEPERDIRGRFSFRHRQYLEDGWQVTVETSYLSDRHFLEWMYRDEFYTDKDQETLIYAKRIWDNQAFSILGKVRVNDFMRETEELPTIEYHRLGQSFWDHHLTFYSSSRVSRMRERFDKADTSPGTGGYYSYVYTRNEVDMPLTLGAFKVVPFVAGSYGFEDRDGFRTNLSGNEVARQDNVFLGETGVRGSTMFWKEDPTARSAFWDVQGLRHIVTPYFQAAVYQPSDAAIDMQDYVHVGAVQRWQTQRGDLRNRRSVDWMRLDVNSTWVRDGADSSIGPALAFDPLIGRYNGTATYGPARFIANHPAIPFLHRRDGRYYGMARDSLNADYQWRVSETFSLLGDANYDMQSGHLQQLNVGVSRYVHPDISYYLGSRYLRPMAVNIDTTGDGNFDVREMGSHSVIGAISWQLTPRYSAMFSQEYNFDFGHSVRSDLTLVRQYHRMFYALSFSVDESLKRNVVMFSIWPQGVDELSVASQRHTGVTGAVREE